MTSHVKTIKKTKGNFYTLSFANLNVLKTIYLLIDFPLIFDRVTSKLTHRTFAKRIVQHKQLHFAEDPSLVQLFIYVLIHASNNSLKILFVGHVDTAQFSN